MAGEGKDRGYCCRGASLAKERWLVDRATDLKQIEQTYIQAVWNLREQERQAQEQLRYRTIIGAGLLAGIVIVIMLAVFAWVQRNQANANLIWPGRLLLRLLLMLVVKKLKSKIMRKYNARTYGAQLAAQSELVVSNHILLPKAIVSCRIIEA
ncbi:MAG: hypothetical protein HS126_40125 [Anaerolineales bacterium]|nr:hypothetical protein [Anaerolineales bacterium]